MGRPMRTTIKHFLEFNKTLPFFISHIRYGRTLSQSIINEMNFHEGCFYTILPDNAVLSQLYEFRYGRIIPPTPTNETVYLDKVGEFHPMEVLAMDTECSEFIYDFLSEDKDNYAILEYAIAKSSDYDGPIGNVKVMFNGKEVYYLLDHTATMNEIWGALRSTSMSWHSLIILGKGLRQVSEKFESKNWSAIGQEAIFIITSAYDQEAYIFWEKCDSKLN